MESIASFGFAEPRTQTRASTNPNRANSTALSNPRAAVGRSATLKSKSGPATENSSSEFADALGLEGKKSRGQRSDSIPSDSQSLSSDIVGNASGGQLDRSFEAPTPSQPQPSIAYGANSEYVAMSPASSQMDTKVTSKALDQRVDDLSQRQAIMQFIKKMQDELGVSAAEVVAAFATLTPQELMQPPEQSVDKLVSALPLTAQQRESAKGYFLDMLNGNQGKPVGEYLNASKRQLSLQVMSDRQVRQAKLSQSLDKMQVDFFKTPGNVSPEEAAIGAAPQEIGEMSLKVRSGSQQAQMLALPALKSEELAALQSQVARSRGSQAYAQAQSTGASAERGASVGPVVNVLTPTAQAEVMAALQAQAAQGSSEPEAQDTSRTEASLGLSAPLDPSLLNGDLSAGAGSSTSQMANAYVMKAQPEANIQKSETLSDVTKSDAGELPLPQSNKERSNEDQAGHDSQSGEDRSTRLLEALGFSKDLSAPAGTLAAGKAFTLQAQPTAEQNQANIREIVGQATVLAEKGGGEMKVQLNPEGLGQVSLRVVTEGGRVQVEMITESDEARKLLERGLHELRGNLTSQSLRVDTIRVDTAADVAGQLTQNHDEGQRQFAQQFMENFRQENNDFKRGFYDMGGPRMVGSQRQAAEDNTARVGTAEGRRREGGRRLDLVA